MKLFLKYKDLNSHNLKPVLKV